MDSLIRLRNSIALFVIALFLWFDLAPVARAVVPPPDGGYPNFNTAEGQRALFNLTTGVGNTAVGWLSLFSNTDGSFNTAIGAGALLFNVGNQSTGDGLENTAIGTAALLLNTTGNRNTAIGATALLNNAIGIENTAIGARALLNNTTGAENTATGAFALWSNSTGFGNTAVGTLALNQNTTGGENSAFGVSALSQHTTGASNNAFGASALLVDQSGFANNAFGNDALAGNLTGNSNTAMGDEALLGSNGSANTAFGAGAGVGVGSGSFNVYLGVGLNGVAGEVGHTYISNIKSTILNGGGTDTVTVDLTTGLLGHLTSSRRYKQNIHSMDNASQALYRLKPVSFRYKKEFDRTQSPAFGLIAEDVAEVNPDLVAHDANGRCESVHYEMVNAMLLNEFLKEHKAFVEEQCKVQKLEANAARQQEQIEALAASLQKVSAQLELNKAAPQTVCLPAIALRERGNNR